MDNILIHNPISHMYGPYFLVFYGCVIGLTLIGCKLFLTDFTANLTLPLIQNKPDPYQIAYLRGEEPRVLQLVGFNLIQRGYLEVDRHIIKQVEKTPALSELNHLERKVFDWFYDSHTGTEMVYDFVLQERVKEYCAAYKKWLEDEKLQYSLADKNKAWKIGSIAAFIILGLGSYKLMSALSRGYHNVGFLFIMAIFAIVFLVFICQQPSQHLTKKGKLYLRQLQKTFRELKGNYQSSSTEVDYNTMLLIALFDLNVLVKSPYENYAQMFGFAVPASSSSSSSNSSSSGSSCGSSSSCSGGSSCGSSCGGGGCGGGCGGCGG